MKLLTFLGIAEYRETTYVWQGRRETTCYCPLAIARLFRPEQTCVVVTTAAEAKHLAPLQTAFAESGLPAPAPIRIPDGSSEEELWAIFDQITSHVAEGEELIVDITNGFRSLPFLSFLVVAFLRVAKGASVHGVYYGGALAANADGSTPIFDLTPFVTLLDWTTATEQFLTTGDAKGLVDLLEEAQRLPWTQRAQYEQSELPRNLQGTARVLRRLSRALRLTRPEQAMAEAACLCGRLQAVEREATQWAKPFGLLLERTARDYNPFALAGDPRSPALVETSLRVQREMVGWYVARRQYVQAIVLAREWLVSYAAAQLRWHLIQDRPVIESALNCGARARRSGEPIPALLGALAEGEALVELWDQIPDLRNDIAHVGMRENPRAVDSLVEAARALREQLAALAFAGAKP